MQKPLNIAVDARPLGQQLTGIGRYLQQLLLRLVPATRGRVLWHLYSDRPVELMEESHPNVRLRRGNRAPGPLFSTPIAQYRFPLWTRRDNIDLFWSPRHHLPILLPSTVKKVVTIHDLVWKEAPETMAKGGRLVERLLMPRAIHSADRIIAVSEATKKNITRHFPDSAPKIKVIYEAACLMDARHPVESVDDAGGDIPSDPYFLFVGTLEPRKNLHRLLTAFAQTPCKHHLIIVGGRGWGGEAVDKTIRELGLRARVTVKGYVSDFVLQNLYRHAHALLMPSLCEGFGLPLLEAMSRGVPVLTGNTSSMPEVTGDAGILVDPLDIASIAKGIQALADNTDLRNKLAVNALRQANRFSWEKAASETLDLLLETAGVYRNQTESRCA